MVRPDLEAVKALQGSGSNRMCQTEAAQLEATIGNLMVVLGSSAEGISALEASLASARALAAGAPTDARLQHSVVEARSRSCAA